MISPSDSQTKIGMSPLSNSPCDVYNERTKFLVCYGSVFERVAENNEYTIEVSHPIAGTTFYATSVIGLGNTYDGENKYKIGDRVIILAPFVDYGKGLEFNRDYGFAIILGSSKFVDIDPREEDRPKHPDFEQLRDPDSRGIYNEIAGSGIIFSASGQVSIIASRRGGPARPRTIWNPNGKNIHRDEIQNICSNWHIALDDRADPILREQFLMDAGDGQSAITSDVKVVRRRFVTKTKDIDDGWVSTCEGSDDPLFIANSNTNRVMGDKGNFLFHKIFDTGKTGNRIEIKVGNTEADDIEDLIHIIIGKKHQDEKFINNSEVDATLYEATATDKFNIRVGATGELEIWSGNEIAGKGSEQGFKFRFHVDADGNFTVEVPKSIVFKAGKSSITLDENEGLELKDANGHMTKIGHGGITVNGRNIVHDGLYDLLKAHAADFGFSAVVGPVSINPAVIAEIIAKTLPGVGKLKTNDVDVPELFNPMDIKSKFQNIT